MCLARVQQDASLGVGTVRNLRARDSMNSSKACQIKRFIYKKLLLFVGKGVCCG